MNHYKVTEIYESVQGESYLAGEPCTFVRFSGCPLRCRWCDTSYSFEGGEEKSLGGIVSEVKKLGPKLVELTGGEPLARPGVADLCTALVSEGYRVMIETSGSYDISCLPKEVTVIMDLKCPESGMEQKNCYENLAHLKPTDEVKFVVASYEDFLWADRMIRKSFDINGTEVTLSQICKVSLSPAFGLVKPQDLVSWMLETKLSARLNLQIHKYIWSPRKKGV